MSMQTTFTSVLRLGFAAALLLAAPLTAQEYRATITGTVTDPSGASVPRAQIEIRNVETSVVTTAQTNDVGIVLRSVSAARHLYGDRVRPWIQAGRTPEALSCTPATRSRRT